MTYKLLDEMPILKYEETILDIIDALEKLEPRSKVAELTFDEGFFCGENPIDVIRYLLERIDKEYEYDYVCRPGKIYFKRLK